MNNQHSHAHIDINDEKYNDDWPEGSFAKFIWERCEADNQRVREIMSAHLAEVKRIVEPLVKIKENESDYGFNFESHHSDLIKASDETLKRANGGESLTPTGSEQ